MHRENLETLHALLIADANNETGLSFNMNFWIADAKSISEESSGNWRLNTIKKFGIPAGETITYSAPINCGTAACAMGLAALSGAFPNLTIENHVGIPTVIYRTLGVRFTDFEAACKLFGISTTYAEWLFGPSSYGLVSKGHEAELEVAKRLRILLDQGSEAFESYMQVYFQTAEETFTRRRVERSNSGA